jgi:hypothetical protein
MKNSSSRNASSLAHRENDYAKKHKDTFSATFERKNYFV